MVLAAVHVGRGTGTFCRRGCVQLGSAIFVARWVLVSALIFLVLAFLIYGQSGPDDPYITYWPARTLAEHGRIWSTTAFGSNRAREASTWSSC